MRKILNSNEDIPTGEWQIRYDDELRGIEKTFINSIARTRRLQRIGHVDRRRPDSKPCGQLSRRKR